jgi:glycylpeptide N-tetradecanoyltransferase
MPQENSKISDPDATAQAAAEAVAESSKQNAAADSADESEEEETGGVEGGEGASDAKKKSRKRKIKDALTGKGKAPDITSTDSPAGAHLSKDQMSQLLELNPALKQELQAKAKTPKDMEELMRKLNINEMLTGLATWPATRFGRRSQCRVSMRWRTRRRYRTGLSSALTRTRSTGTPVPCTRDSSG